MPSTTRSTFFTYPTKFGPVTIAADGTAVTAVSFGEQNLPGDRQPTALTTEAANQIMAYLAGQRSAFTVPMRPDGSAFQQEVWKAAANIPYGHTTTARALAETLGRPGSFRSVGAALRACPTPLLVPTHRSSKKAYTDTRAKKPTTTPLNQVKILMSTSLARAGEWRYVTTT